MIYNGTSISAVGINQAMEWGGIPAKEYTTTANKIVLYYTIVRDEMNKRTQKGN